MKMGGGGGLYGIAKWLSVCRSSDFIPGQFNICCLRDLMTILTPDSTIHEQESVAVSLVTDTWLGSRGQSELARVTSIVMGHSQ